MNNLILRRRHRVPIYELAVTLYVAHDAVVTFNRLAADYGLTPETKDEGFKAMSICDGHGRFALFFNKQDLTENAVTHEVRHCTDDILAHIGHSHCNKCSNEPHAYLSGYLQAWVKRQLKTAGIRLAS